MPSGILWIAIAKAIAIPRFGSEIAAVKVARPSGKLWIAIARAVKIPSWPAFCVYILPH
jgi:hypothetical protein